jgi:hypothetical protein
MLWQTYGHLLQHVPKFRLEYDGHCRQAVGLDLFIAVINHKHRPYRLSVLSHRMVTIGLDKLIRVPAFPGADLTNDQLFGFIGTHAATVKNTPHSQLTLRRLVIGCFMLHLAIWRCVLRTQTRHILLFENDSLPAADFASARFRATLSSIHDDVGLVLSEQRQDFRASYTFGQCFVF